MNKTKRPTSSALEEIMFEELPVLRPHSEHQMGWVRLTDYHGGDTTVQAAARSSYGKEWAAMSDDKRDGLIRRLMRLHHTSPFEMARLVLQAEMPIFVARQWVRHRTASLNEFSARYKAALVGVYLPEPDEWRRQSGKNHQGGDGFIEVSEDLYEEVQCVLRDAHGVYHKLLDAGNERGQARFVLPLGTRTRWLWAMDLHNLLHFLRLRMDSHAQAEIRAYADVIGHQVVRPWVPTVWQAFKDYRLDAVTFSGPAMRAIRQEGFMTNALTAALGEEGLTDNEIEDVLKALELST